ECKRLCQRTASPARCGTLSGERTAAFAVRPRPAAHAARSGPPPASGGHTPMLTVDDYQRWPAAPADLRHAYGPHPDQFGDLYLPVTPGPHPVIILLHGGCWRERFGLAPLGPLNLAL